jgi:hypothetical protein
MKTNQHLDDYFMVCIIGDNGHCGLMRLLCTTAIVGGINTGGYDDRWCYHTFQEAMEALDRWKDNPGDVEPDGWHRHPPSGRRRPDGNKDAEHVDP